MRPLEEMESRSPTRSSGFPIVKQTLSSRMLSFVFFSFFFLSFFLFRFHDFFHREAYFFLCILRVSVFVTVFVGCPYNVNVYAIFFFFCQMQNDQASCRNCEKESFARSVTMTRKNK